MKAQSTLFSLPENNQEPISQNCNGKPRIVKACRNQYEFKHNTLDEILPKDHLVRDVWAYVETLDLAIVLGKIKALEGGAGRPATDPKILLSLWLFATIKSIGSSRVIEQYCKEHDAFKWICGGVNINYHTVSDFRTDHGDQLDELLTASVVALSQSGLISLEKVSQDGVRVRASAGSSSFRREATINDQLVLAEMLISDIKEEEQKSPGACKTRLAAAEKKSAEDRLRRLQEASEAFEKIRDEKIAFAKQEGKKIEDSELEKVRVSKTDVDARVMKMACNGFRPAYNIQFGSSNIGKAVVAVEVSNKGTDNKEMLKMMEQVEQRYGIVPNKWFVDGGYRSHPALNAAGLKYKECEIFMPVLIDAKNKNDPYKRKSTDSKTVGDWRERMGTDDAKELYKERAATAELVNAQARNRGLQQFLVRGIPKVKCVALIYALTHNMMLQIGQTGFNLLSLIKDL